MSKALASIYLIFIAAILVGGAILTAYAFISARREKRKALRDASDSQRMVGHAEAMPIRMTGVSL